MGKFIRSDIDTAYRKLKSYVYYDNFSLLLRQQIAQFESSEDFDARLDALTQFLRSPKKYPNYLNSLLKDVDYHVAPKKYKSIKKGQELVISNNFSAKEYHLEKVNYFFEGPIEVHLISVLWILNEGYHLHNIYSKENHAYFLELSPESGRVVDGLRMFKPYFDQYQRWRDTGIDIAKNILKEGTDVVILSLDIKEYYYNTTIDSDFQDKVKRTIEVKGGSQKLFLTDVLFDIMKRFQEVFPLSDKKALPIGLLSSGILANFYLTEFDKLIKRELSPAYYGRYVDDIQIVLSNTQIAESDDESQSAVDIFLKKYLVDRNICKVQKNENGGAIYKYIKDQNIQIQKDKILLYAFESKESQAVLDMFKKKIERNSSAFWFLPAENDIEQDFDESVYELSYSDTVNKLRSVEGINQSKYGAAVFLAKKIKVSLLSQEDDDIVTTEQILTFFKGIVSLEFSSTWEKVFTYFVVKNDTESFWKFFQEITRNIEKIKIDPNRHNNITLINLKKYLNKYLENCCALATALNPSFVTDFWWEERKKNTEYSWLPKSFEGSIAAIRRAYIGSSLLRNSFIVTPLLNYLNVSDGKDINYLKHNHLRSIEFDKNKLKFNEHKLKYAPRYIYFSEFNLNLLLQILISSSLDHEGDNLFNDEEEQILYEEVFDVFFKTNYEYRLSLNKNDLKAYKDNLKNYYFQVNRGIHDKNRKVGFNTIRIPRSGKNLKSFRIALANTKVQEENIEGSIFEKPNTSRERRKELISILNSSEKEKADVLVLPEVSVPYSWLPLIAEESRRKQRLMIVGLEHLTIRKKAFNFVATSLPLEHNGIRDAVINLRLKYHYSPHESKIIHSRRRIVPKWDYALYNLFIWRGIHFGIYNCYELADIDHRSIFKGKVDVIFASEYNRDVNYFSNIAESISRDVHSYFVQVNSSNFGDSRITVPKKSAVKDIMRLKGGENSVVLRGNINVEELRKFQSTEVLFQNTSEFKNTPPNFNHSGVEER